MSIYKSVSDSGLKTSSVEWRPATFVENISWIYSPGRLGINQHNVCFVAFSDVSSFINIK